MALKHGSFPASLSQTIELISVKSPRADTQSGSSSFVFHHFPITRVLVSTKYRQFSVLGFARGSSGSSRSTTELRPLVVLIVLEKWFLSRFFVSNRSCVSRAKGEGISISGTLPYSCRHPAALRNE